MCLPGERERERERERLWKDLLYNKIKETKREIAADRESERKEDEEETQIKNYGKCEEDRFFLRSLQTGTIVVK